jgi:hypothetical protein
MATTDASDKDAVAMRPDSVAGGDKGTHALSEWASDVTIIILVLSRLVGNISTLCAAACVSRAWRVAAATPSLWVRIGPMPKAARQRLNDARLQSMAVRAADAGGFTALELNGTSVTDDGLKQALRQQRRVLTSFITSLPSPGNDNRSRMTGSGVAAALKRFRGHLRVLNVGGLQSLDAKEQEDILGKPEAALHTARCRVLRALRKSMAPECSLDVSGYCAAACTHGQQTYKCGILCTPQNACASCKTMRCNVEHHLTTCEECLKLFCRRCFSDFGPVCEGCADAGALDGWHPEEM